MNNDHSNSIGNKSLEESLRKNLSFLILMASIFFSFLLFAVGGVYIQMLTTQLNDSRAENSADIISSLLSNTYIDSKDTTQNPLIINSFINLDQNRMQLLLHAFCKRTHAKSAAIFDSDGELIYALDKKGKRLFPKSKIDKVARFRLLNANKDILRAENDIMLAFPIQYGVVA